MDENKTVNVTEDVVQIDSDVTVQETEIAEQDVDVVVQDATSLNVDVQDENIISISVSEAFPFATDALGDAINIRHGILYGREFADQHPISAITGLRDELDEIEALKTVYSNGRGVAQYYLWDDNNEAVENRIGYFVSICPDGRTIKICRNEEVFGVVVDEAAFVGGQDAMPRDYRYGLITNTGIVDVRCELDVEPGDYVIPNDHGVAQKIDSRYGLKVIALNTIDDTVFATISLDSMINQMNSLGQEMDDFNNRVSGVEINIVSAMNIANNAYSLASNLNDTTQMNAETIQKANDALDKANTALNATETLEGSISSAQTTATQAKIIAESALSSATSLKNEAVSTANTAYQKVNDLTEELTPITTWTDASGNSGANYFVHYIDNGVATKAEIATIENLTEEAQSAIQTNAKSIQSLLTSIDKYSVGEFSQAYGLTREQAASILKPGMVYIPTKHPVTLSHNEVYQYTDASGQVQELTQSFTPGYYYIWGDSDNDDIDDPLWRESTYPLVAFFSDVPVPTTGLEYWYVDSSQAPEGYEPYTLYAWLDEQWTKVNILDGNVTNRVVSRVQQNVDSVTAEVTNARGSAASLDLRLTDFETQVNLATFWNQPESNKSNLAAMRLNSDDSGSDLSLIVMDQNGDEVVHGASIVLGADGEKSHINIDADYINFEGFATFVRPDDLGSNGATNIDGARIVTGVIHSANYDYEATDEYGREQMFSKAGTSFDLTTGTIISNKFRVDEGSAYLDGIIVAREGAIAQFNIKENAIYSNQEAYDGNDGIESEEGVYLGTDGIGLGAGKFYVDKWGNATLNGDIVLNGNITWGTGAQLPETLYFYYLSDMEMALDPPVYDGEVVSIDWYPYPLGVSEDWPYEYVSQCNFKNGEYICTTPVLWAKYAKDGIDGGDAEITDEMMFNWFTDDGSKGGIFSGTDPESGKQKLFINADYIRTGALTFGDGNYFIKPGATKENYLELPGLTVASGGTSLSFGDQYKFYINDRGLSFGAGTFLITPEGKALLAEIGVGMSSIGPYHIHSTDFSATKDIQFNGNVSLTDALNCILTRLNDLDHRGTTMGHNYVGEVCIQCSKGGSGGNTNTCAHTSYTTTYEYDTTAHWNRCTSCGEQCNIRLHLYDPDTNYWGQNATQHWRVCADCQVPYDHADHSFNENGECADCGYQQQADACTHPNLQPWEYKAPTCTEDGNNECWYCPDCYEYFSDENASTSLDYYNDVVIGFLGHDFPAVYTDFGTGYHALVCNRCGEYAEGSYHAITNPDAGCTICNK